MDRGLGGGRPVRVGTRPALDPWEYAEQLAELGAWGVTFHDNDVFPFDADEATKERIVSGSRRPPTTRGW